MSSSDSEKGEIKISLIVVYAHPNPHDMDFQVFLSEIWKLGNNNNNRQAADYALTIGWLLKNSRLSAN